MHESGLARALARLLLACGVTQILFFSLAFAQSLEGAPMIFDVRRSLPLEPDEPVFHDFYIDAGPEAGFKKGMFVTVVRGVPVHDPFQNKQQGTLRVPVATLRVIHVDKNITVARLFSQVEDEFRPTLEFEAVMIGDRVDAGSMTMEAPEKPKSKKNSWKASKEVNEASEGAQAEPPAEQPTQPSLQPVIEPSPQPGAKLGPQQTVQIPQEPSLEQKNSFPGTMGADIVRGPSSSQPAQPL